MLKNTLIKTVKTIPTRDIVKIIPAMDVLLAISVWRSVVTLAETPA